MIPCSFDHYNESLGFKREKLFLDDGWDTDEIWNLIVGETTGDTINYNGTSGQDILLAGLEVPCTVETVKIL